ncbi:MAG: copper amine oxidase N-terminal domain-containing protein [Clostridiales bacterium]|jgi:hypothetical protein|nr:copper amine oxidase N-terminal domain-containing protein [Clostridiales bacterium]MDR2750510.1 copper amine oxidase N-terminal domain-containing protein [Clostridiales bacterium]
MRIFAVALALAWLAMPVAAYATEAPDIEHHIERTGSGYEIVLPNGIKAVKSAGYTPLIINGSIVDADVIIENGRTLAPIRAIVESLGGEIGWNDSEKKATIKKDGTVIELVIGNASIKVDGVTKETDVAPMLRQGYTYLPVRFVSENLGADVSWLSEEKLVGVVSGNVLVDQALEEEFISREDAIAAFGELFKKYLPDFKKDFEAELAEEYGYDGPGLYSFYANMEFEAANARVTSEISRFYVLNGFLLFDKYTGNMYQRVVVGDSEATVSKIEQDSYEGCSWIYYRHLTN